MKKTLLIFILFSQPIISELVLEITKGSDDPYSIAIINFDGPKNINNQIVSDIYFKSQGSALSIACGSIMCCEVKGMGTRDVMNLCFSLSEYVLKGTEFSLFGELEVYRTIIRFSERHDCSLLCWRALKKSLSHTIQ